MNESFEEFNKIPPDEVAKTNNPALVVSFLMMIIYLFVFFSMINVLDEKFQRIVVCLLTLIFIKLQLESQMNELKEYGKNISATSGSVSLIFSFIPFVTAFISLIYFIFF